MEQRVGPDPPPIESLPDSLLSDILRMVSEGTGDVQHTLVCRKWNQMTASAQRRVHMKQHVTRDLRKRRSDRSWPRLGPEGVLELGFWPEGFLFRQLHRFRSLTALEITDGIHAITDTLMGGIMMHFPGLKSLKLGGESVLRYFAPAKSPITTFAVTDDCLSSFAAVMGNLKTLEIRGCDISSFPRGLSALTQIEELAVGYLSEDLPEGLELSHLKSLRLEAEEYDVLEFPGPITSCTRLTTLDVEGVGYLTEEVGTLASLVSLRIRGHCHIPHTISSLVRLTNLRVIGSGHNTIDAAWLRPMSALRSLEMDHCDVASPGALSDLRGLTELEVDTRYLAGCDQRSAVTSLSLLRHGEPWVYIRHMTALRNLGIHWSNLPVPSRLWSFKDLRQLYLEDNKVADELPCSIGQLRHLKILSVTFFPRLLSLPHSIGSLTSLASLTIGACPEFDCMPDAISGLCALNSLILEDLPKLEEIPASVGALRKLTRFNIDRVSQAVQLPQTMTLLTTLRELTLEACHDTCIPDGLDALPFLRDHYRKRLVDTYRRRSLEV